MEEPTLLQFEKFLKSQGLRLTGQRQQIASAFFEHKGHISSEELYRQVQRTAPSIGFATVYRTLKLLCDSGLAISKNFRGGYARFEALIQRDHHDHLVCTQCGAIVEFVNNHIEDLQDSVAAEHGFKVTDHSLDIYGICTDCQSQ